MSGGLPIVGIHGAPRSGTSWLGQLFNSSEHVAYRYQPFFSYAFKERLSASSGTMEILRFFDDLRNTEDDFVLQQGKSSLSGYTLQFHKVGITHLVYKEVRYHDLLPVLLARCPDFRCIGLVRNPCAVIHSWMHAPREFDPSWSPNEEWRDAQKKNLDHPENWYGYQRWKELALLFEDLSARYPERFRIARYDMLCERTPATLTELFDFCGVPFTAQVLAFARSSQARDDGMPYGVFRDASRREDSWVTNLDECIISAIQRDLQTSLLARYLEPC